MKEMNVTVLDVLVAKIVLLLSYSTTTERNAKLSKDKISITLCNQFLYMSIYEAYTGSTVAVMVMVIKLTARSLAWLRLKTISINTRTNNSSPVQ